MTEIDQEWIREALYCLDPRSGVSIPEARGAVTGLYSALRSVGLSQEAAEEMIYGLLPTRWRREAMPLYLRFPGKGK